MELPQLMLSVILNFYVDMTPAISLMGGADMGMSNGIDEKRLATGELLKLMVHEGSLHYSTLNFSVTGSLKLFYI